MKMKVLAKIAYYQKNQNIGKYEVQVFAVAVLFSPTIWDL
jgi:hypothetical protein